MKRKQLDDVHVQPNTKQIRKTWSEPSQATVKGRTTSWTGKIIWSENNSYHCWIKEAVEIWKCAHRTVNQDKGAYMLSHTGDAVLNKTTSQHWASSYLETYLNQLTGRHSNIMWQFWGRLHDVSSQGTNFSTSPALYHILSSGRVRRCSVMSYLP